MSRPFVSRLLSIGIILWSALFTSNAASKATEISVCDGTGDNNRELIIAELTKRYPTTAIDCATAALGERHILVGLSLEDVIDISANSSMSDAVIVLSNVYQDSVAGVFESERFQKAYTFFKDPNPRQQLLLSKAILSDQPSLLLLHTNATTNIAERYVELSPSLGVDIRPVLAANEREALRAVLDNRDADGILLIPDKTIYNTITLPNIMRTSYQLGIPLIGFSPELVNSGVLATTFPSLQSVLDFIISVIDGHTLGGVQPHKSSAVAHSLAVNRIVARSLNLHIPTKGLLIRSIQRGGQEP